VNTSGVNLPATLARCGVVLPNLPSMRTDNLPRAKAAAVWSALAILTSLIVSCSPRSGTNVNQGSEVHDLQMDRLLGPIADYGPHLPPGVVPVVRPRGGDSQAKFPGGFGGDLGLTNRLARRIDPSECTLLLEEIRKIANLYARHSAEAEPRRRRLIRAFEVLGTNAAPLTPELAVTLRAGTGAGDCAFALAHIGAEAWPVLVDSLTTTNTLVRLAVVRAAPLTDRITAGAVLPTVLAMAGDTNQDAGARASAILAIPDYPVDLQPSVPVLTALVEKDEAVIVRIAAAKSLARLGRVAGGALPVLQRIADREPVGSVRGEAEHACKTIESALRQ
jgi:hypothetical protein